MSGIVGKKFAELLHRALVFPGTMKISYLSWVVNDFQTDEVISLSITW